MALAKTGLGFPVACLANATTTVYANPSATTTYVRSMLVHNRDDLNSVTIALHMVQNSSGVVGSVSNNNQIFRLTLQPYDTYFVELAFPVTLTAANDSIRLVNFNTTSGDDVNVLLLGDKEA